MSRTVSPPTCSPVLAPNPPPTMPSLPPPSSSTICCPETDGVALPHANVKLSAKHYESTTFTSQLLDILDLLRVPCWSSSEVTPQSLRIHKVSGALTNSVFFVFSSIPRAPTLLLRIYGSSSASLVSRLRELHTLHLLSSQYHIGPKVYGTFSNGRIEEYFDSVTLTPSDLRDKKISRWVAARMAELHSVDLELVERYFSEGKKCQGWKTGVERNVKSWLIPARDVLGLACISDTTRESFNLDGFEQDWVRYMRWVSKMEDISGASKRVFAHNDTQYGNLLRLKQLAEGTPEHRQIIVVDFEYASPNPAAFDIANHFHEWTANYHSLIPHILDSARYPSYDERRNFYIAYLEHSTEPVPFTSGKDSEVKIQQLDKQVRVWSPASHAMWAMWGLVQAREDLEGGITEPEFDYLGYAQSRIEGFRQEIKEIGIP